MLLPYQATVPWPQSDPQQDWIDQIVCIETWIKDHRVLGGEAAERLKQK
jgi:hypothetical protein